MSNSTFTLHDHIILDDHKRVFERIMNLAKLPSGNFGPDERKIMVRDAEKQTALYRISDSGKLTRIGDIRKRVQAKIFIVLPGENPPLPEEIGDKILHFDAANKTTYLIFKDSWSAWLLALMGNIILLTWYNAGFVKSKSFQLSKRHQGRRDIEVAELHATHETLYLCNRITNGKCMQSITKVLLEETERTREIPSVQNLSMRQIAILLGSSLNTLTGADEISWFIQLMKKFIVLEMISVLNSQSQKSASL